MGAIGKEQIVRRGAERLRTTRGAVGIFGKHGTVCEMRVGR
jgi:hypothetical protein